MKKLKARLDAFSDAVIAIILTIMVLDLTPVLKDNISDYLTLAKEIGVYIISFAFVANNWYQHATLFNEIDDMSYRIMLYDFLYLIPLSLTPLATNMMASNTTSITVVAYGILVAIVSLCFRILARAVTNFQYTNKSQMQEIYTKIYGKHNIYFSLFNVVLIVLGYFFPQIVLWFFLPYPLVYMVFSSNDRQQMYDAAQLTANQREQYLQLPTGELRKFQKLVENGLSSTSPDSSTPSQEASEQAGHHSWLDRAINPENESAGTSHLDIDEIRQLRRKQWQQFLKDTKTQYDFKNHAQNNAGQLANNTSHHTERHPRDQSDDHKN